MEEDEKFLAASLMMNKGDINDNQDDDDDKDEDDTVQEIDFDKLDRLPSTNAIEGAWHVAKARIREKMGMSCYHPQYQSDSDD